MMTQHSPVPSSESYKAVLAVAVSTRPDHLDAVILTHDVHADATHGAGIGT